MNILFCTNAFEKITNGPAKFANLILEINRLDAGHQVRVLTEDVAAERLPELRYVYQVQLHIPTVLKPLGQVLRMFQYYRRVKQIAREYPFDVLVYNNAFTGLYASLRAEWPTVGMINDDNNLATTLSNFRLGRLWTKRYFFRQLEKIAALRHRCIITNSAYLTRQVQQAYRVPPGKIFKLYKAVDLTVTQYTPGRSFASPVKILFVKTDFGRGGLDVLAQALGQLLDFAFVLTVIGPQEQFRAVITRMFAGIGNVQLDFRGEQPPDLVRKMMQTCDIFCVPSLQEALGVANMEALASGIPVVSTRAGGIPEVLDEGRNGWLVEPGKPRALAAALRGCITDPARRAALSANGKQFVEQFSKEAMFSHFIGILGKVCG
jgi:glycosyltransferase involved in cell wall biosynthesis